MKVVNGVRKFVMGNPGKSKGFIFYVYAEESRWRSRSKELMRFTTYLGTQSHYLHLDR